MNPQAIPLKNIQTKALVVNSPGQPFTLQDIVLDEVRTNELLVEMLYTGVCHTVCAHYATTLMRVNAQISPSGKLFLCLKVSDKH